MDPFVAEIRIFPFNFPPKGWAFCDGQLLPISQNTALFSLLGTTYGGNGMSNFALPNLQGMGPIGFGQGSGLSNYDLGQTAGSSSVALLQSEIPSHSHGLLDGNGQSQIPAAAAGNTTGLGANHVPAGTTLGAAAWEGGFSTASAGLVDMAATDTFGAGSSSAHNNLPPYLTLNFCIAMQGVYPPRS